MRVYLNCFQHLHFAYAQNEQCHEQQVKNQFPANAVFNVQPTVHDYDQNVKNERSQDKRRNSAYSDGIRGGL